MAKFTEETLTNWTKPPSDSEETKLSERMVREAISEDEKLKSKLTETFGQGSYANNTNVRLNSDIDINVKYTGGFYFGLPEGKERSDFGLNSSSNYSYAEFKDDVEKALINGFDSDSVERNDKCITIRGNTYRVETDVVPTWEYRKYNNDGSYVIGVKFCSDSSKWIVNYPKQHIENGKNKNSKTYRRFKKLTRLHRKLRYKMIEDGENVSVNITSFLLECLVWNVPNRIINDYETWTERLKNSIVYLYNNTKEEDLCKEWGEVSELLYLFRANRKWSREDVNLYLEKLWNYLEF
jgi:hypothetical protein